MRTHTIEAPRENRRIAHGEAVPRWSWGSRLALGAWTMSMPILAVMIAAWALGSAPAVPPVLYGALMGMVVLHFMLLVFYVSFAAQNPRLGRAQLAWLTALVLAGPVAIPAYWLVHVWYAPRAGRGRANEDDEVPGSDDVDRREDLLGH